MGKALYAWESFYKAFRILLAYPTPSQNSSSLSSIHISLAAMLYQHIIKLNINFLLLFYLSALNSVHLCFWREFCCCLWMGGKRCAARREIWLIISLINDEETLGGYNLLFQRVSLQLELSFKWAFQVCSTLEMEFPLSISRQMP